MQCTARAAYLHCAPAKPLRHLTMNFSHSLWISHITSSTVPREVQSLRPYRSAWTYHATKWSSRPRRDGWHWSTPSAVSWSSGTPSGSSLPKVHQPPPSRPKNPEGHADAKHQGEDGVLARCSASFHSA